MRILVIDDEAATESLFRQRFKEEIKAGLFDFNFSLSAEEAIDKINQSEDPGAVLILSDINMPGMSGLQLLKQLKSDYPKMPVMMVTAYGDEVNHKKAIAYRADGFINKPIDFEALKEKILKFLPKMEPTPIPENEKLSHVTSKILVVDDEPALEALIRQKFRRQIKNREMEFTFANNGVEALEILEKNKDIGIILTDINMPEMDGLTLLGKLKEKNRLFRSIVISAYGDMENIRSAMNLGASDFITKPIDLKDLATTLDKIREQYHCLKAEEDSERKEIENNKELEIAYRIQKAFIPTNFTPFSDSNKIELYGEIFASKTICCDFFDFFQIGDRQLGFVIADVSGKGVPAALFMAMSKTLLRSTALENPSPKECIRDVSHFLSYNNESMMFVTAFYGIIDINTGVITYCDAGHLPPYIISKDGSLKKVEKNNGIALGILDDLERANSLYEENKIHLEKGDCFILYTDGVIESRNIELQNYTNEQFENSIKKHFKLPLKEFIFKMHDDIHHFTNNVIQYDDITLFCIRWNG